MKWKFWFLLLGASQLAYGNLVPPQAGLRFTENMRGFALVSGVKKKISVHFNNEISDIDAWSENLDHPARIQGILHWADQDLKVQGWLSIMTPRPPLEADPQGYYLRYEFETYPEAAQRIKFIGAKHIYGAIGANPLDQLTHLKGKFVEFSEATGETPPVSLRFEWANPLNLFSFLGSFQVTNASGIKAWKVKSKFLHVWFAGIFDEYFWKYFKNCP